MGLLQTYWRKGDNLLKPKCTTVIVTRPIDRASGLIQALDEDYHVVCLPCLEIVFFNPLDFAKNNLHENLIRLQQLKFSLIIFASVNAVEGLFKSTVMTSDLIKYIKQVKVYAIGSVTAKKLEEYGIKNVIFPNSGYQENSESFLSLLIEHEGISALNNHSAVLIRGEASREYLSRHLSKLVASWSEVISYQTSCPEGLITREMITQEMITESNKNQCKIIILVTSLKILENFYSKLSKNIINEILAAELIVISSRIADYAKQLGFSKINCTNCINDQVIIDMIRKLNKL